MSQTVTYSIIIPVYCESNGLFSLLEALQKSLKHLEDRLEIVIVDDGSPDNTWEVLEQLSTQLNYLHAARLSRNFGKEYALAAGLDMARGEAIIVMDGDLQHPPELVPEMISLWEQDRRINIVEAVKSKRGRESLISRIGAKVFYSLLLNFSGFDLRKASDFKLLDRKALDAWRRMDEHNLFFRGMTAWLGFCRVQIPFSVPERSKGESKWSFIGLLKLATTGITSFSSVPLQFVTFSGCIFLFFSIVLTLQSLFLKITGQAVDGFSTVIILLLIIGSLIMISLGIIGTYIARIYDEVKRRPRYLIAQTLNCQISEYQR